MEYIKKKEWVLTSFLFLIGIFSRVLFLEKIQSHWDGPDYSIALVKYSFVNFTPSPPGYPLYIAFGRFFNFFVDDLHIAILLVSVLFAGVGAVVFYLVGKTIFSKRVGIIASLIFLSAPVTYYFGITANPYGILPTTAAFLAMVVFLIVFKKKQYGLLLGVTLSFCIGVRPQDGLFLLPLYIFGWIRLVKKQKYVSSISFILSFLIWFLPTAIAVGGIKTYISYVLHFVRSDSMPQFTIERILSIWLIIAKGLFLTLGISILAFVYFLKYLNYKLFNNLNSKTKLPFFAIWIIPSLFFNLFIRSDHAAHQMTYLSALIILAAYCVWKITQTHKVLLILCVAIVTCFNLFTFFRDRDPHMTKPYISQSYHYSELKKNDLRMPTIVSYVTNHFFDKNTFVLVDPEIFRPVTYYLKNYHVFAYSSLDTNSVGTSDIVHHGFNWNYEFVINKNHILKIPQEVWHVVIIPNNKNYSINASNVKKIKLAGNTYLYEFTTKPLEIFDLSVHTIDRVR